MFRELKVFLSKLDHTVFDLESENNYSSWKFFNDINIPHAVDNVFRVSRLSSVGKKAFFILII